jgi:hypothetical protein
MGIIINIDETAEKMQPGEKITFSSLDFITDWFGNLHLQEPKPPMEEKEQPPSSMHSLPGWRSYGC